MLSLCITTLLKDVPISPFPIPSLSVLKCTIEKLNNTSYSPRHCDANNLSCINKPSITHLCRRLNWIITNFLKKSPWIHLKSKTSNKSPSFPLSLSVFVNTISQLYEFWKLPTWCNLGHSRESEWSSYWSGLSWTRGWRTHHRSFNHGGWH